MGTIAARDAVRVDELAERVLAIALLAACQALELRGAEAARPKNRALLSEVRRTVPANTADRRQDGDIEAVVAGLRAGRLGLGSPGEP